MSEGHSSGKWEALYYGLITSILDKVRLSGIGDYEKCIAFVLRNVKSHPLRELIYDVRAVEKSSGKSQEFRIKGNQYFTSSDDDRLDKAIEEYTKSVAYAPNGSRELGLAYGNRSAVLFKAKLISDCLLDIQRALQNNFPDNLKAKLYFRKAMCLQILDSDNSSVVKEAFNEARKWTKQINEKDRKIMEVILDEQEKSKTIDKSTFTKWNSEKFMPKLVAENPRIPGLSDAVDLQYSEKWGRHMVATRDIKTGEILVAQKAYATVIQLDLRYRLCWNCEEQTWASVPCERCVEVVFCSEKCRNESNLASHDLECPIIASMIALKMTDGLIFSLRLMVKAHQEVGGCIETLEQIVQKVDAEKNPLVKGFTNNSLDPDKIASVFCLENHESKRLDLMRSFLADSILMAYLLAKKSVFFGPKAKWDFMTLASQRKFVFIVRLFIRLIETSDINNFRTMYSGGKTLITRKHSLPASSIILPALSFFNHSCVGMDYQSSFGKLTTSTASCPIKKGDQIFICYEPNYFQATKTVRQACFTRKYYFSCICEACENDWPEEPIISHEGEHCLISRLIAEAAEILKRRATEIHISLPSAHRHIHVNGIQQDIARIAETIDTLHCQGFKRNSMEIFAAEQVLFQLLMLINDRFLFLFFRTDSN